MLVVTPSARGDTASFLHTLWHGCYRWILALAPWRRKRVPTYSMSELALPRSKEWERGLLYGFQEIYLLKSPRTNDRENGRVQASYTQETGGGEKGNNQWGTNGWAEPTTQPPMGITKRRELELGANRTSTSTQNFLEGGGGFRPLFRPQILPQICPHSDIGELRSGGRLIATAALGHRNSPSCVYMTKLLSFYFSTLNFNS